MNGLARKSSNRTPRIPPNRLERGILAGVFIVVIVILASCTERGGQLQGNITTVNADGGIEIVQQTPLRTATPMNINRSSIDEITQLFNRLYPMTACRIDLLARPLGPVLTETFKAPQPEFIEVNLKTDQDIQNVEEVADNNDKSYQAFVACNQKLCQPKIFVKNLTNGKVYEINWEERFSYRDIQAIIWINHDVLAFY